MRKLYFGSYPIGGFSFGFNGSRDDPCCSPDKCGRWSYRFAIDLFVRGFEIEWADVEARGLLER